MSTDNPTREPTHSANYERLVRACLRWHLSSQDEPSANYDAEMEYCEDLILAAAQALVAAHIDGSGASRESGTS